MTSYGISLHFPPSASVIRSVTDQKSGVWSLESGVWSLESGVWSLESGVLKSKIIIPELPRTEIIEIDQERDLLKKIPVLICEAVADIVTLE